MLSPHHSISYKPDALRHAQPTTWKHWRQSSLADILLYSHYKLTVYSGTFGHCWGKVTPAVCVCVCSRSSTTCVIRRQTMMSMDRQSVDTIPSLAPCLSLHFRGSFLKDEPLELLLVDRRPDILPCVTLCYLAFVCYWLRCYTVARKAC